MKKIKILYPLIFLVICNHIPILQLHDGNILELQNIGNDLDELILDKNFLSFAGSWYLTPFIIDDSGAGDYTWAQASSQPWCTGTGTRNDPYIIENVTIDGQHSDNCLTIKNSKVYFVVRYCNFFDGYGSPNDGGIKLISTSNGTIINNDCSNNVNGIILYSNCDNNTISNNICENNYWMGIFIENNCDNNTIKFNKVRNNKNGIWVNDNCRDNMIMYNNATDNYYYSNILFSTGHGITLTDYCERTIISNNNIIDNTFEGLYLRDTNNDYCEIYANFITNNGYGLVLHLSDYCTISRNIIINNRFNGLELIYCDNNIITHNKIEANKRSGIKIQWGCDWNTIKSNEIVNNINYGINFGEHMVCENNLFYNNTFIKNGVNALIYDHCPNNYWYSGTLGNYWGDYTGNDDNGDKIGDTPYDIPGYPFGGICQDPYPIYRDDYLLINNVKSYNWLWAKSMGYCSGFGTSADPYVIRDQTINNSSFPYKNGIVIMNSDVYFRIENCTIKNLKNTAIFLRNVNNGFITQNNCTNNGGRGVKLINCDDYTIRGNHIVENANEGFRIENCNYLSIENNTILSNKGDDIICWDCTYLFIKENIIRKSLATDHAIYIWNGDYVVIKKNTIIGPWTGIYFDYRSNYNTIVENYIDPEYYGILINHFEATDFLIYKNTVISATEYAWDQGSNNNWDNGTIGNYWGNYGGVDLNDDGIGDTPYNIIGMADSQDKFPIWDDGENGVPPNITIISPLTNQVFGLSAPIFNLDINEMYINTSWYQAIGGSKNYTFTGISGIINQTLWNEFGEGIVVLRFYVNDSVGNLDYDEVIVKKDFIKPYVNINTPTYNDLYGKNPPSFNVYINETFIDAMWYSLDNGLTNITFISNDTFDSSEWNKLQNGSLTIYFYANDSVGNIGFDLVEILIDIISPSIKLYTPTNYSTHKFNPLFTIEVREINFDSMWYSFNSDPTKYTFSNNETLNLSAWNSLSDGPIIIRFYANDTLGNINFTDLFINKDTFAPVILVDQPKDGGYYNTPPNFVVEVNDSTFNSLWYSLNGNSNITVIFNTTINSIEWNLLLDGPINIRFYANDSLGYIGFVDINIIKDTIVPYIFIDSPSSNQLYGITVPSFNVVMDDLNLQEKWYSLNRGQNFTFTSNVQFDQAEWNKIGNGTVLITFYSRDKAGNINFSEVIVRKDAYKPVIVINSPLSNKKFGINPPDFNISIVEETSVSTWYTIEGSTNEYYFTDLNGIINESAWNATPEGSITITFYARDAAGNIGFEMVTIIKEQHEYPSIYGYDLILLIGTIWIITIIIIKKIKNLK